MLCFLILIALLNDLSEKQRSYLLFSRFGVILFFVHLFIGTNNLTSFDFKIGFVTPIGGLLLIVAWGVFFQLLKKKTK
jgi:uncharacterized membrane protein YgdD (TMEM256/DUF423 family)